MGSVLAMAATPGAPGREADERSRSRPWLCSHASGHAEGRSVTSAADKAPAPGARVDRRARSQQHPWPRSFPACVLPRSTDLPLSLSDTPLADGPCWAIAAVFGLLWSALLRSSAISPTFAGFAFG